MFIHKKSLTIKPPNGGFMFLIHNTNYTLWYAMYSRKALLYLYAYNFLTRGVVVVRKNLVTAL